MKSTTTSPSALAPCSIKKLINRPEAVVEEMVQGMVAAYSGLQRGWPAPSQRGVEVTEV